ncbi:RNA exonuclease 4 [Mercurialis annua]|uniref:RNA exonuclease 4 n=1 Tax=Mercurialis annua TaxID=3986 RepID=UPI00215FD4EA|nr:RNA exonuclease 4 [Mercurialis annua]
MGKEEQQKKKNPKQKKQLPLNPNWAQFQQKLKSHGSRPSRPSNDSKSDTQNSILGKRKERPDAESDESQINPLAPTNDDFSLTDVIAMDCEMVGIGQANKSALGRITLVNQWGNVIFDEFVRPIERVTDFRTAISGIRPQHLKKAKAFPIVQKNVGELIKGRILVGHALSNDFKALLMSHPKKDLRDTSEYQPFLKERHRKALRHLASEFLGVEIQNGEHCSIEDARAAMLLYQRNKKEWERSLKDRIRLKQKQKKRKPKKKPKEVDAPDGNCDLVVAS